MARQLKWIGVALVAPAAGSEQAALGYTGAYGSVACVGESLVEGLASLVSELSKNQVVLIGFEWLLPIDQVDRPFTEYEQSLLARLDEYPIQFRDMHWFRDWSSRH